MRKEKAMKKNHMKIVSVCFLFVVVILFVSSCGKTKKVDTNSVTPGTAVYTFGYNNFGQGAYPLDLIEKETVYIVRSLGMNIRVANNEFTVDKLITDAQNLIASQVDGLLIDCISDTLFSSFSRLCEDNKVPFTFGDRYPTIGGEEIKTMLRKNPYFVGFIGVQYVKTGARMADAALAAGHKTAIIVGAAVGDLNHDRLITGFTEAFEKGGGKVLATAHCADPSEAVQKSNDLLTAYSNADCLYGPGGDFSIGALSAMESRGISMPIYGTDIDPTVITAIREGKILAATGGISQYCAGITATLLMNYLDGHPMLDENGQAPMTDGLNTVFVTTQNVDDFETHWINGHPFTQEEIRNLCWRYNPNVTWQDYVDLIENYSFETRMATFK
jgi:ribose transport system substrate-binding protein